MGSIHIHVAVCIICGGHNWIEFTEMCNWDNLLSNHDHRYCGVCGCLPVYLYAISLSVYGCMYIHTYSTCVYMYICIICTVHTYAHAYM